ncbi:hypothetical protein OH76DRAFT_1408543 [Lentinus brumalis]|uniref:Uncharacterized protein n=1 Tax=Lentinus brumalis TaxID=2498619 RepID=A0A371CXC7_9APHY|nr:hypothetical protein OH76DRAFT_1408543 [Polyporus brumalis]
MRYRGSYLIGQSTRRKLQGPAKSTRTSQAGARREHSTRKPQSEQVVPARQHETQQSDSTPSDQTARDPATRQRETQRPDSVRPSEQATTRPRGDSP